MPDSATTIIGNLTRDPELRFTPNGVAVANFGVAVNRRKKVGDDYEDEVSFFDVSAFGSLGENLSESLARGNRVMVVGQLQQRSWENDEGEKRSKIEIVADAVGPDLRWATASVAKTESKGTNGNTSRKPTTRQPVKAAAAKSYDDEEY